MKTVTKTYESDGSGIVRVDVAVGAPHRQVEVVVVWQEAEAADVEGAEAAEVEGARSRKRAELEALAGALADEPIERPAQPVLEVRRPIE